MDPTSSITETRSKILVVINHKSGSGNDVSLKGLIAAQAKNEDFDYRIYSMSGNDEEKILAEIKSYEPTLVAAAGGDGTVKMMAGILAGTDIPLAIIPYGSANGMAKELGINNIDTSLDMLSSGKDKTIDLIDINGHICIHLSDIGLNARIVKRFEEDPRRGISTYARHLFGEMFLLKKYRFNISYDAKSMILKGVSITFANASKYGTGAVINPAGLLDDGKFELVIVKPFPRIKLLSIAWKMFLGSLDTSDYVEIVSCKTAKILTSKKTTLQIDGEVIGKVKEINLKILPGALRVLIPAEI